MYCYATFDSGEMKLLERGHMSPEDKDVNYLPEVFVGGAPCSPSPGASPSFDGDTRAKKRVTLVRWACAQDGKERLEVGAVQVTHSLKPPSSNP